MTFVAADTLLPSAREGSEAGTGLGWAAHWYVFHAQHPTLLSAYANCAGNGTVGTEAGNVPLRADKGVGRGGTEGGVAIARGEFREQTEMLCV